MPITTSVSFPYRDNDGQFIVDATVYGSGIVRIENIKTDDGYECDINDWTITQQFAMKGLARVAAERLDDGEEDDNDNERDLEHKTEGWR